MEGTPSISGTSTPSSSAVSSPPPQTVTATQDDIERLGKYVSDVGGVLGGAPPAQLNRFMQEQATIHTLRKFIQEAQLPVLVLTHILKDTQDPSAAGESGTSSDKDSSFALDLEVTAAEPGALSLAFIKTTDSFDVAKPLPPQLHVLSLGNGTPFKVLHTYFHNAVTPYFLSYASKLTGSDSEKDVMGEIPVLLGGGPPPPPPGGGGGGGARVGGGGGR